MAEAQQSPNKGFDGQRLSWMAQAHESPKKGLDGHGWPKSIKGLVWPDFSQEWGNEVKVDKS